VPSSGAAIKPLDSREPAAFPPPPAAGNRETVEYPIRLERAAGCDRISTLRARMFMVYAEAYIAHAAVRQRDAAGGDHGWIESPLYMHADLCRQMQLIGSGHASSGGIRLSGDHRLAGSPFAFDRPPQTRLSETAILRRALTMVRARHPPGSRAADMLAELHSGGFACNDVEDSISTPTGECRTPYGVMAYTRFEITWFSGLVWHVEYRAAGNGSLENV